MNKWNTEHLEQGLVYALQDQYALENPDRDERINDLLAWLDEAGWTLAEKVLDGVPFTENELPFRWLAQGVCVWRADKCIYRDEQGDALDETDRRYLCYGLGLVKRAQKLIREGYFGKSDFNPDELETLHLYRLYCECRILHVPVWPYELGIHEHGKHSRYYPAGAPTPADLCLPTFDSGLREPDYTEAPPPDPFEIIKPEALNKFRILFDGYEAQRDADGRQYVTARPVEKTEGMVCLGELIGKKPVVLILAAAMDSFWDKTSVLAEHLYQAYGDRAAFYWVNIEISDFLIRSRTTRNYYKPWAGLENPGSTTTIARRAQTAKKLYMTNPHITCPCLLDTPADIAANLFHTNGGSGTTVLIGLDGKVAWQSTHNWSHWFENRPPARGSCEEFAWADEVERELRAFLGRGACYQTGHPSWNRFDEKSFHDEETGTKNMYLLASRIDRVDTENGLLYVTGRVSTFSVIYRAPDDREFFNEPHPMVFHIDETTEVTRDRVPLPLSDLQPGDIIGGPGFIAMDEPGHWRATRIAVAGTPAAGSTDAPLKGDALLTGKIISTSPLRLQPLLDKDKMIGYRFIEQDKDRIELSAFAETSYQALCKWLAADSVELICRDDTWLSRNGEPCTADEIQTDDIVTVWYQAEEAGSSAVHAALIHASETG